MCECACTYVCELHRNGDGLSHRLDALLDARPRPAERNAGQQLHGRQHRQRVRLEARVPVGVRLVLGGWGGGGVCVGVYRASSQVSRTGGNQTQTPSPPSNTARQDRTGSGGGWPPCWCCRRGTWPAAPPGCRRSCTSTSAGAPRTASAAWPGASAGCCRRTWDWFGIGIGGWDVCRGWSRRARQIGFIDRNCTYGGKQEK